MEHVSQVAQRIQESTRSSEISNTPRGTSDAFTPEQIAKTTQFFARLRTIFGRSKLKSLWSDEDQLRQTRREWAGRIGQITQPEFELIFSRLKELREAGHPDYEWPDVARIIGLARNSDMPTCAAHKRFKPGLPQPEWRKREIRQMGLVAAQAISAALKGKACLLEDKPRAER